MDNSAYNHEVRVGELDNNRTNSLSEGMTDKIYENIAGYKTKSMKNNLKAMDTTIEYLNDYLLCTFFKQGLNFGIFETIKYNPKLDNVTDFLSYPNKDFLIDYIKTAVKLGIIKCEDKVLELNSEFQITLKHPLYDYFMEDYILRYDFMANLARYALISYDHPDILLNFKKDADIWDMISNTSYSNACREIIAEYLDIDINDSILDVGCGSRSPEFYASRLGPNGKYTGVDFSKKLLKIAENRVKRQGMDWATLKPIDFRDAIIKNKYDYVICTYTLKYAPSIKTFLKKMMDATRTGGKVVIAEEFFKDTTNVSVDLFEFYNRLNKFFGGYVSKEDIINTLDHMGYDFEYKTLSNGIFVIEKL
ncbi:MAG: hypothetical protein PWP15_816 [Methanothermococcus sp.]|jgi:ubiquinone/menaquinone biosynthesis C-methylase UbiE|uniref:class I SAM-dependent methyltransferase n=1 Tax=Methanothermococcus TaxID=155862 RepID=UPI000379CEEF|nr:MULTISPECIES: class I SAM-dependent methyltransferase [Methanothermococcus]MDK2790309.1 hypothetical protein [Methanothermococcus sp.]